MIAQGDQIIEYIPQRPPVVMIDTLLESNELETNTSFLIQEDNLFCENGVFTESGLMENIAQTAAARVGYECKIKNVPVPPGFIGAIKNLEVKAFPKTGQTIQTSIRIENEVLGITLISGVVHLNGNPIATAEMKILLNATSHL